MPTVPTKSLLTLSSRCFLTIFGVFSEVHGDNVHQGTFQWKRSMMGDQSLILKQEKKRLQECREQMFQTFLS